MKKKINILLLYYIKMTTENFTNLDISRVLRVSNTATVDDCFHVYFAMNTASVTNSMTSFSATFFGLNVDNLYSQNLSCTKVTFDGNIILTNLTSNILTFTNVTVNTTYVSSLLSSTIIVPNGTDNTPDVSFANDANTGINYSNSVGNNFYFVSNANNGGILDINNSSVTFNKPIYGTSGTEQLPMYSFENKKDSGLFNAGDNQLALSYNGDEKLRFTTSGLAMDAVNNINRIFNNNGSVAAPTYTFANDTTTGISRGTSVDTISISTSGTQRMVINNLENISTSYPYGSITFSNTAYQKLDNVNNLSSTVNGYFALARETQPFEIIQNVLPTISNYMFSASIENESRNANFTCVAYSPPLNIFVALASNYTTTYSINRGVNWLNGNLDSSITSASFSGVAWASGSSRFVAVMNSSSDATGYSVVSTNGITWTKITTPSGFRANKIRYFPELNAAFALGNSLSTDKLYILNDETTTWVSQDIGISGDADFRAIAYSPELRRLIILGRSNQASPTSDIYYILYSDNSGVSWTNSGVTTTSSIVDEIWTSVDWSPMLSMYVAVADPSTEAGNANSKVMYSYDGKVWSNTGITGYINTASAVEIRWIRELKLFATLIKNSALTYAYSTNGLTWEYVSPSLFSAKTDSVARNANNIIATGFNNTTVTSIISSTNTTTWNTINTSGLSNGLNVVQKTIVAGSNRYITISSGIGVNLQYSDDNGVTWINTSVTTNGTNNVCFNGITSVAYASAFGPRVLYVGRNSSNFRSTYRSGSNGIGDIFENANLIGTIPYAVVSTFAPGIITGSNVRWYIVGTSGESNYITRSTSAFGDNFSEAVTITPSPFTTPYFLTCAKFFNLTLLVGGRITSSQQSCILYGNNPTFPHIVSSFTKSESDPFPFGTPNDFAYSSTLSRWVAVGVGYTNSSKLVTSVVFAYSDDNGQTWTSILTSTHPNIITNEALSVIWDSINLVFIATGKGGAYTMATSTDGINWTGIGATNPSVTNYANISNNDFTYSSELGQFLSVSNLPSVVLKTDGLASNANNRISYIFNNYSSTTTPIVSSTNGTTWNSIATSNLSNGLNVVQKTIVANNNRYITVSNFPTPQSAQYSDNNGATWINFTVSSTNLTTNVSITKGFLFASYGLVRGGGVNTDRVVYGGYDNNMNIICIRSTLNGFGGTAFTELSVNALSVANSFGGTDVQISNVRWIAVGYRKFPANFIIYYSDTLASNFNLGINIVGFPNIDLYILNIIRFYNDIFIIGGKITSPERSCILYGINPDPINLIPSEFQQSISDPFPFGKPNDFAYSSTLSRWVAVGVGYTNINKFNVSNVFAYSDNNGETWTSILTSTHPNIMTNEALSVIWDSTNSIFIATGLSIGETIATSTDGINWTGNITVNDTTYDNLLNVVQPTKIVHTDFSLVQPTNKNTYGDFLSNANNSGEYEFGEGMNVVNNYIDLINPYGTGQNLFPQNTVEKFIQIYSGTNNQFKNYFGGCLLPDGNIFLTPYDSNSICIVNPNTNDVKFININYRNDRKFRGCCFSNNKVYCAPYDGANFILVFHYPTSTYYFLRYNNVDGILRYQGVTAGPNNKIYFIPDQERKVMIINTINDEISYINLTDNLRYCYGVLRQNGEIICGSGAGNNTNFLVINTNDDSIRTIPNTTGIIAAQGGCLGQDGSVYFVPLESRFGSNRNIVKISPDDTLTTITLNGTINYGLVANMNGRIYIVTTIGGLRYIENDIVVNTGVTSINTVNFGYTGGILLPDNRIAFIPYIGNSSVYQMPIIKTGLPTLDNWMLGPSFNHY